jgi:hypothetical protein
MVYPSLIKLFLLFFFFFVLSPHDPPVFLPPFTSLSTHRISPPPPHKSTKLEYSLC